MKAIAISGWLTAIALAVGTLDYKVKAEQAAESACKCKPEIKGRELVASMCQAPTIRGPWEPECLYAKGEQ